MGQEPEEELETCKLLNNKKVGGCRCRSLALSLLLLRHRGCGGSKECRTAEPQRAVQYWPAPYMTLTPAFHSQHQLQGTPLLVSNSGGPNDAAGHIILPLVVSALVCCGGSKHA